jgi:hypothetical protein
MARFDDPTVRYDADFFYDEPETAPPSPPQPKTKRMKRQTYYPSRAADQVVWLENFRNKLPVYQAALGLTATQVTDGVGDARWIIYVLGTWLPAVRAFSPACTDAAAKVLRDEPNVPLVLPTFTAPALPATVVPKDSGALDRVFDLVQLIKDLPLYTEAIGLDLGVVGPTTGVPDLNLVQPELTVNPRASGVDIGWGWGGNSAYLDLIEIQVDRGAGFVPLTFDTTPGYTDTAALPATPTRWTYRAIFRVGDAQVGLWSAEVSGIVGG